MSKLPQAVDQLLTLFESQLANVSFADTSKASLEALAKRVEASHAEAEAAEAALHDARTRLADAEHALLEHAERALGYARVYAHGDDALTSELDCIALSRSPKRARGVGSDKVSKPTRRRGRKLAASEVSLPLGASVEPGGAESDREPHTALPSRSSGASAREPDAIAS